MGGTRKRDHGDEGAEEAPAEKSARTASSMKVAELRSELGRRGLDCAGLKADLVARLQVALDAEASAGAADLDEYLAEPLEAVTGYTLTDPDAVRERVEMVRSLGYAWGYEEGVDGLNSVAVPVLAADATAVAAIHVHGPAYRFPDPDRTHDLGLRLIEAAGGIAAQLDD